MRFLFIKQSTFGLEKKRLLLLQQKKKPKVFKKYIIEKKIKKNIGLFRRNLFKNKIKIGNYAGWLNLPVYVKKNKEHIFRKISFKKVFKYNKRRLYFFRKKVLKKQAITDVLFGYSNKFCLNNFNLKSKRNATLNFFRLRLIKNFKTLPILYKIKTHFIKPQPYIYSGKKESLIVFSFFFKKKKLINKKKK